VKPIHSDIKMCAWNAVLVDLQENNEVHLIEVVDTGN
jgi:hypothetical protein